MHKGKCTCAFSSLPPAQNGKQQIPYGDRARLTVSVLEMPQIILAEEQSKLGAIPAEGDFYVTNIQEVARPPNDPWG